MTHEGLEEGYRAQLQTAIITIANKSFTECYIDEKDFKIFLDCLTIEPGRIYNKKYIPAGQPGLIEANFLDQEFQFSGHPERRSSENLLQSKEVKAEAATGTALAPVVKGAVKAGYSEAAHHINVESENPKPLPANSKLKSEQGIIHSTLEVKLYAQIESSVKVCCKQERGSGSAKVGGGVGVFGGMLAGGAAGSIIPGVGTIAGIIIGGVGGTIAGGLAGGVGGAVVDFVLSFQRKSIQVKTKDIFQSLGNYSEKNGHCCCVIKINHIFLQGMKQVAPVYAAFPSYEDHHAKIENSNESQTKETVKKS